MFTQKKDTLFTKVTSVKKTNNLSNAFINAGLKKSSETFSGNGSLKYTTSGNAFTDQFNSLGIYRKPREYKDISADCELLWSIDKKKAVMFNAYIRLITRQVSLFDGSKTESPQKGGELKHEGIMRMIWLHQKDQRMFWQNIGLFVSMGSWNDVIKMLQYDLVYNGWEGRVLNWDKFGRLILSALNNDNTSELLKKYLPQIKANSACKTIESQADTIIGKWICSLIFGTKDDNTGKSYRAYRKLKSNGTAHEWQKLISQGKHKLIDFNTVHGRALMLLSRSKYLKNQGLEEKYTAWITKPETKEVKYTGFVSELFMNMPDSLAKLGVARGETINKQFQTLVNKGGENKVTKLIVVRDTSGSMSSKATGLEISSHDIAKSMALYFSQYMTGAFSNSFIEFNSKAKMHNWVGDSTVERWYNDKTSYNGGTDFQSVIDLFCNIKSQGVSEEDFPSGMICISDGNFNPAFLGKTNVEYALMKLRNAGFSEGYVSNFIIALWDIPNSYYGTKPVTKFETMFDVPNVFYFSGYNASIIGFLTSEIKTASELVDAALSQEILQMIKF